MFNSGKKKIRRQNLHLTTKIFVANSCHLFGVKQKTMNWLTQKFSFQWKAEICSIEMKSEPSVAEHRWLRWRQHAYCPIGDNRIPQLQMAFTK